MPIKPLGLFPWSTAHCMEIRQIKVAEHCLLWSQVCRFIFEVKNQCMEFKTYILNGKLLKTIHSQRGCSVNELIFVRGRKCEASEVNDWCLAWHDEQKVCLWQIPYYQKLYSIPLYNKYSLTEWIVNFWLLKFCNCANNNSNWYFVIIYCCAKHWVKKWMSLWSKKPYLLGFDGIFMKKITVTIIYSLIAARH